MSSHVCVQQTESGFCRQPMPCARHYPANLRQQLESAAVEVATFESDAQRIVDAIWPIVAAAVEGSKP